MSSGYEAGDSLLFAGSLGPNTTVALSANKQSLTITSSNGESAAAMLSYLRQIRYININANITNTTKTLQITGTDVNSGNILPNPYQYNISITATPAFTVTQSNSKILINGLSGANVDDSITLIRGNTYIFDVSDSSLATSPTYTLRFYSQDPSNTNSPTEVTTTRSGTTGNSGATVTLTVPNTGQLYFWGELQVFGGNNANNTNGGQITFVTSNISIAPTAPNVFIGTGLVDRYPVL